MDAPTWNKLLDAQLTATGLVDQQMFARFDEAYGYDAASTIGWVEAKLKVLGSRLRTGRGLELFDPDTGSTTPVRTRDGFVTWIERHFPAARPADL